MTQIVKKKKEEVKSYQGMRLFFWQNVDLLVYLFKAASSEFFKKKLFKFYVSLMNSLLEILPRGVNMSNNFYAAYIFGMRFCRKRLKTWAALTITLWKGKN